MSVSRCFRCALEAARPAKRINIAPINSIRIQSRPYADLSTSTRPEASGTMVETITKSSSPHGQAIENLTSPPKRAPLESTTAPSQSEPNLDEEDELRGDEDLPPNVQAAYRLPYKHPRTHGVPVASLQLRSYSVRNLEFMADFALRVATYLELPVSGPVPLPKRIERWTMPRSNFVHKKSQENFERITLRRLITAYDGHPEVVEIWLACLRKWQYYGVGMKANVFQYEGLNVGAKMDEQVSSTEKELDEKLALFGFARSYGQRSIKGLLRRQRLRGQTVGSPQMDLRDEVKYSRNADLFVSHRNDNFSTGASETGAKVKSTK